MKWNNKWHELDAFAHELVRLFIDNECRCIVYGAGIIGCELLHMLEWFGCFGFFIDNSMKKVHEGVEGKNVVSFAEYQKLNIAGIVVIAADKANSVIMENQLKEYGKVNNKDFFRYIDFLIITGLLFLHIIIKRAL